MSGLKVLVTGSSGLLGRELVRSLKFDNVVGLKRSHADISNPSQIRNFLDSAAPNLIIHSAAMTDVELCEVNPDDSYRINCIGTQNLVNFCIIKSVPLVLISSTGVYGTSLKNCRYTEFDPVLPTTVHHSSKFEAEKIVRNHLQNHLIIRTGWLYGGGQTDTQDFVKKRIKEARSSDAIYSNDVQVGNPTNVTDLVNQINVLLANEQYGTFNCVNAAKGVSRFKYIEKICSTIDASCKVKVAPDGYFGRVANVSNNESAVNYKLDLLGLNVMRSWDEALVDYISELGEDLWPNNL